MSVLRVKNQQGFTLVELLVTITIFVLLTGIVLFNQTKFNSTILLTNLAYDTALTIRQAQNYGINIKEFDTGSGGKFYAYGVHFQTGANNKSFVLFADSDVTPNGIFDGTPGECITSEGCVNKYSIKRGNYIDKLCEGADCSKTKLDIVFKRPNPDALIKFNSVNNLRPEATIVLKGVDGSTRKVHVQSNGLIEIINQ